MTNPRTKGNAESLVKAFADSIIKQNQAVKSGTTRQVRYYGNKIMPIAKKLINMGDDAIRQFATLLQHPDLEVKATAAVYLMSSLPDEALAVFREMAEGDDEYHAMCAKMRIKEWEEHPEHYDESNWV